MASKTFEYDKRSAQSLKSIEDCGFSIPPGYLFSKWTFDLEGLHQVSDPHLFTEDTNVYAQWQRDTYSVHIRAVNCTVTCNSIGTYLEELMISWTPNNSSYRFDSVCVYAGTSTGGTILYKNMQDDGVAYFTMIEEFDADILVEVIYVE